MLKGDFANLSERKLMDCLNRLGLVGDNYLGRRIDSSVLLPVLTRCLT